MYGQTDARQSYHFTALLNMGNHVYNFDLSSTCTLLYYQGQVTTKGKIKLFSKFTTPHNKPGAFLDTHTKIYCSNH